HMGRAGVLGGLGFTMSLIVASLAIPGHPELDVQAKLGILMGSGLAAALGLGVLAWAGRPAVAVRPA
nr:Na+/H+ antiporter NhaA [Deltaproteobacteria bacterium]